MPFRLSPLACLGTVTRSFLLSLCFDHVFIDFLAHTALGAAGVLLAILFVSIRARRPRPLPGVPKVASSRAEPLFRRSEGPRVDRLNVGSSPPSL